MKNAVTNKIRLLKHIEPSPDWLKSQRSNLLLEISQSGKETKLVWSLPGFLMPNFAFKPVVAFCLLLCLIFGGGFLTVQAAKGSSPGDLLYPIKIIVENTRVKISSELTKPRLQAEFVGYRAEELNQIVEEEADNPVAKKEKVVKAVDKLQAQVASTRVHLDKIKQAEPGKVIEVVEAVSEKTAQSQEALIEAKEKLVEELEGEESEEVVRAIDEALAVLLAAKKAEKEIRVQMEVIAIEPTEEEEVISAPVIPVPTVNEASEDFEDIEDIK